MGVMIKPQKPKLLLYLFTQIFLASDIISGRQYHRLVLDKDQISALRTQQEYVRNNSIKTIQFANGDVYDCVDIYKQPAFLHPKLKDHKLQMSPTVFPAAPSSTPCEDKVGRRFLEIEIPSEDECPEGSVPIQRLDLDVVTRDTFALGTKAFAPSEKAAGDRFDRFWGVTAAKSNYERTDFFYGGGATINAYAVPNVGPLDISAAVMWIINHDAGAILRVGWQVKPSLYNDTKTRLFMEWSADHDKTICVNTQCPGFVVVNKMPIFGLVLTPLSIYLGQQIVLKVYIYRDPTTGNWWLAIGNPRTHIGYWPEALFNSFKDANQINFGGYVTCEPNKRCPPMGNGVLGGAIRGKIQPGCFITNTEYYTRLGLTFNLTKHEMSTYTTDTAFATVGPFEDVDGENTLGFTFGGPGY